MKEIIINGVGGQGSKLAGDCMVYAAFLEGKYAQAFPSFGVERRAGRVMVFYRLDDKPIRKKCSFVEADCFLLMDESILKDFVSTGLTGSTAATVTGISPKPTGLLLIDESILKGFVGATGITDVKLKGGGIVLANTKMSPKEVKVKEGIHLSKIATLDATSISEEIFGKRPIPIVNTTMMGAFAKATGWLKLNSIVAAIKREWPAVAELNTNAAKRAFEETKIAEF